MSTLPLFTGEESIASIGGDPDAVDLGADDVRKGGRRVDDGGDDVRLHGDEVVLGWSGTTADAAHESLRLYAARASVAGESIAEAKAILTTYATVLRQAQKDFAAASKDAQAARSIQEEQTATLATLPPVGHRGPQEKQMGETAAQTENLDAALDAMATAAQAERDANRVAADAIATLVAAIDEASALALTTDGTAPTLAQARTRAPGPEPTVVAQKTTSDTADGHVPVPVPGVPGPVDVGLSGKVSGAVATMSDGTFQARLTGGLGASAGKKLSSEALEAGVKLAAGAEETFAYSFTTKAQAEAFAKKYSGADGYLALRDDVERGAVAEPYSTTLRGSVAAEADAKADVGKIGTAEGSRSAKGEVEIVSRADGSHKVSVTLSESAAAAAGLAGRPAGKMASTRKQKIQSADEITLSTSFDPDGKATKMSLIKVSEKTFTGSNESNGFMMTHADSVSAGERHLSVQNVDLTTAGEHQVADSFSDAVDSGDPLQLAVAGKELTEAMRSAPVKELTYETAGTGSSTRFGGDAADVGVAHTEDSMRLVP